MVSGSDRAQVTAPFAPLGTPRLPGPVSRWLDATLRPVILASEPAAMVWFGRGGSARASVLPPRDGRTCHRLPASGVQSCGISMADCAPSSRECARAGSGHGYCLGALGRACLAPAKWLSGGFRPRPAPRVQDGLVSSEAAALTPVQAWF